MRLTTPLASDQSRPPISEDLASEVHASAANTWATGLAFGLRATSSTTRSSR
jgi:hypothetical protein